MYALQYSQITKPRSSNRSIYCGLVPKSCRSRVLDDWCSGNPLLDCIKKSRSRFVHFRKMTNASMKYIEHLSLKRPRKRWMHLWMKHVLTHRLLCTRPLVSKCTPVPLLRAIMRTLCHLVRQWWGRSHCPGSSEAHHGTSSANLADLQIPVLRIFQIPQFNMGADPITMSAIRWQGCHCSKHGGN